MSASEKVPNPGSPAAVAAGCICPVLDNCHGRGWRGGLKDEAGDVMFVWVTRCELHGLAARAARGEALT